MTELLMNAGEGWLDASANGQGTTVLNDDPVAKENRPPAVGWCDTCYIARYEDTDLCQWYGRRPDGRFWPHGKIMALTEAGKKMLGDAR